MEGEGKAFQESRRGGETRRCSAPWIVAGACRSAPGRWRLLTARPSRSPPVLRVTSLAGGVVVDESHRHDRGCAQQRGERQEAPAGLAEEDDDGVGAGGRMDRA